MIVKLQMEFNIDKYKVLTVGTSLENTGYDVNNTDVNVGHKKKKKKVILIQSNLRPQKQCPAIRKKRQWNTWIYIKRC